MRKTTLVLGATDRPWSYAYQAISRLVHQGFTVLGIGKKEVELFGVQIVKDKVMYPEVHTVTMYLNAKNQKEYYDYLLALRPERVLFNPGSENGELEEILKNNNIAFERACTLVLLGTGQY